MFNFNKVRKLEADIQVLSVDLNNYRVKCQRKTNLLAQQSRAIFRANNEATELKLKVAELEGKLADLQRDKSVAPLFEKKVMFISAFRENCTLAQNKAAHKALGEELAAIDVEHTVTYGTYKGCKEYSYMITVDVDELSVERVAEYYLLHYAQKEVLLVNPDGTCSFYYLRNGIIHSSGIVGMITHVDSELATNQDHTRIDDKCYTIVHSE